MKQILSILVYLCVATAMFAPGAHAQNALNGAQFEALTKGKTFYFGKRNAPYGAEQYLDNRRVIWSYLDGECESGYWYEEAKMICFVYENRPDPQCWSFFDDPRGLIARFENDPSESELYEVEQSPQPMLCLGPKIGV